MTYGEEVADLRRRLTWLAVVLAIAGSVYWWAGTVQFWNPCARLEARCERMAKRKDVLMAYGCVTALAWAEASGGSVEICQATLDQLP